MSNNIYTGNPGLLFYKIYFSVHSINKNGDLNFNNLEHKNNQLINFKWQNHTLFNNSSFLKHCFQLKTVYPGLLCGSGYAHDLKQEDAFKIGFFFDYTTGLPVIPGSSVKGMIRSLFPGNSKNKYHNEKSEYIKKKLTDLGIDSDKDKINELENEIFEGTRKNKNIPIFERDKFFDAFIISPAKDGLIFGDDTLCPHGDNPLRNPTPLSFLKVLPGVTFQFNFFLNDSEVVKNLSADKKLELFNQIILDFGIGAKTSVGYGQFQIETGKKTKTSKIEQNIPPEAVKLLKKNNQLKCTVIDSDDTYYAFQLLVEHLKECRFRKNKAKAHKKLSDISELKIGMEILIQINNDYQIGSELNFTIIRVIQ